MEQTRKWKTLGWEGALVLLGALAASAFAGIGSCDQSKTSGIGAGSAAGASGTVAIPGPATSSQDFDRRRCRR